MHLTFTGSTHHMSHAFHSFDHSQRSCNHLWLRAVGFVIVAEVFQKTEVGIFFTACTIAKRHGQSNAPCLSHYSLTTICIADRSCFECNSRSPAHGEGLPDTGKTEAQ